MHLSGSASLPRLEPADLHRLAWQLLATDPDLLAEYCAMKENPFDYDVRKREFFARVVGLL